MAVTGSVVTGLDAQGELLVPVELWQQRQANLLMHWMKIRLVGSVVAELTGLLDLAWGRAPEQVPQQVLGQVPEQALQLSEN